MHPNKDSDKTYKPTAAMIANARRGLALREKYKREHSVITKSATQPILEGSVPLDIIKSLHWWFIDNESNYRPKEVRPDGGPTDGTINWLIQGGSAGRAWAKSILAEEQILKSYSGKVLESDLNTEDVMRPKAFNIEVQKALNEELMQVTYVAMQEGTDLHGDYTSLDEVRKAKESFNKSMQRANLFHLVMTDSFSVIESYLAPADMTLNEHFVAKGTWLMTLQVHDDTLWQMIKSGEISGISIGAVAKVEPEND